MGKDALQPVMVWIHGGSHQNGPDRPPACQSG
ncbi:MAG: hypothetical protein AAF317_16980 [Pseudomonadota bacterium]